MERDSLTKAESSYRSGGLWRHPIWKGFWQCVVNISCWLKFEHLKENNQNAIIWLNIWIICNLWYKQAYRKRHVNSYLSSYSIKKYQCGKKKTWSEKLPQVDFDLEKRIGAQRNSSSKILSKCYFLLFGLKR